MIALLISGSEVRALHGSPVFIVKNAGSHLLTARFVSPEPGSRSQFQISSARAKHIVKDRGVAQRTTRTTFMDGTR